MERFRICIAGKNNIAIQVAKYILDNYNNILLCAVFNQNDNGTDSFQRSFRKFCKQKSILETNLELIYDDAELIFLSLEFDKIIKPHLFASKKLYNIHFSYLPEYKGMYTSAMPILNGEDYSGVTLHKIDCGIDTGEIISQERILITDGINAESLYCKYIDVGSSLVINNLDSIIKNNVRSSTQPCHKSSYYSKKSIDYSNIEIKLNLTAFQIQRQISAFVFPIYQLPKVYDCEIYKVLITNEKSAQKAGVVIEDNKFYLKMNTVDYNVYLYKDLRRELFELAQNGSIADLEFFMINGYAIQQRSKEGWDIAIIAAYNGQYGFLDYLINHCCWDVHTCNYNGTTLAMYLLTKAVLDNETDYLESFLRENDINITHCDYSGMSFSDYACKYDNIKIMELIDKLDK